MSGGERKGSARAGDGRGLVCAKNREAVIKWDAGREEMKTVGAKRRNWQQGEHDGGR